MSRWSIYDNDIYRLCEIHGEQWMVIAREILDGQERTKPEVESLADYIRKNKKRFLYEYKGVSDHAEVLDVDLTQVNHGWLKHKKGSFHFINRDFVNKVEPAKEIDFLSIFKDKIEPVKIQAPDTNQDGLFDRLVYSDCHVGMEVNKSGFAMYGGKWDESELMARLETMVNWTLQHQKSDKLHIHDLGDFMDGYNAETTRGGHKLPQNMDNQKAFDIGMKFKIKLVDALMPYYSKITCVNITNDNHGGSFSYIVNSAVSAYLDLKYSGKVQSVNQREFIDHYKVENKIFVLTHGKDLEHKKFGFKPFIDDKTIKYISEYIDHFKLNTGFKIEFGKGDSHYWLTDKSASKKFWYYNYPSFAPPSDWIKHNFQDAISGFVFSNYWENGRVSNHDYEF